MFFKLCPFSIYYTLSFYDTTKFFAMPRYLISHFVFSSTSIVFNFSDYCYLLDTNVTLQMSLGCSIFFETDLRIPENVNPVT